MRSKEDIKKIIEAYIKQKLAQEISTTGAVPGFAPKYAFKKKEAKNEAVLNPRKNPKPTKSGLPSTFVKGTKNNVYTKSYGYKEIQPKDMLDASFLWNEKLGLKNSTTLAIPPAPLRFLAWSMTTWTVGQSGASIISGSG